MSRSQISRLARARYRLLPTGGTPLEHGRSTTEHVSSTTEYVHSTAEHVHSTAEHARSTAEHARSTAEHAHSTANYAHSTAEHAQSTTEHAQITAEHAHLQLATEDVFRSRSVWELLRTVAVYQVCAVDKIVNNSLQLLRLGERLLGGWLLQRLVSPFYRQFVAGSDRQQLQSTVTSLRKDNVRLMLTSMLEADVGEQATSENQLNANLEEAVRQLLLVRQLTTEKEEPAIQTKFTAHMDVNLLVHASRVYSTGTDRTGLVERLAGALVTSGQVTVPGLTRQQQADWDAAVVRLKTLGDACARHNMTMYVDGEFSYTNPAISWITLALMATLNRQRAVIRATQQCYFKATPANLERDYDITRQLGVCYGAKLVRGAYMARERQLAQQESRDSPVCDTYEKTNDNYTQALDFALRRVAEDRGRTQIMVATHNYDSIVHALRLAAQLQLVPPCSSGGLSFGQVYGMGDYLTLPLGRAGHRVYKAVPFGDFSTVMPYLSRRAAESRLVQQGVRLERQLLLKELASRISRRGSRVRSAAC